MPAENDLIQRVLRGEGHRAGAKPFDAIPIRSIEIGGGLASRAGDLVSALGWSGKILLLEDPDTMEAAGSVIEKALRSRFQTEVSLLPRHPHPDEETAVKLKDAICASGASGVVAVGSGTVNDLAKYSSFLAGVPYSVFGTAPSMNGYTSVTAAITSHGHKKSIRAHVPEGVFLDLDVLSRAPIRMIRAGLGDSLCRCTAQADWLLSHFLWGTPYREEPFDWLLSEEEALFGEARALVSGDAEVMGRLARTLVLSGFGMTAMGGSYSASQGEHLISHWIEMNPRGAAGIPETLHGEQIGVTTLTMAGLQHGMLMNREAPRFHAETLSQSGFAKNLGDELGASCFAEYVKKQVSPSKAEGANAKLRTHWSEWREILASKLRPVAALRKVLKDAGAPIEPAALGWSKEFYADARANARLIRDRYTFLDFEADTTRS